MSDVIIIDPPDIYHPPLSFKLILDNHYNYSGLVPVRHYTDFKSANMLGISDFLFQFNWDLLLLDHLMLWSKFFICSIQKIFKQKVF